MREISIDQLIAEHDQLRAEVERLRTWIQEEVADNVTCGGCCECANDLRYDASRLLGGGE